MPANLKSVVCQNYYSRINDEVAVGEFYHDHRLKAALQLDTVTEDVKRHFGVPSNVAITMYDITKKGLDILPQMRFVYLASLIEAFVEDYICERSGITIVDIDNIIKPVKSAYGNAKKSTSFYNIEYISDILNYLYSLDLSKISPVFMELGPIRNCIVHDAGQIKNPNYLVLLTNTLTFLGLPVQVNVTIKVTKKLMAELIEETRKLIRTCDY